MRQAEPRENSGVGARLAHIRASHSQRAFAEMLGVPLRTYQTYERDERDPDLRTLRGITSMGWSATWLVSGIGPELLRDASRVAESAADYASHDLSEEHLTIALELADNALGRDRWLPRPRYALLVRLLYQGLSQGLPDAQILQLSDALAGSMAPGGGGNGGKSGLGSKSADGAGGKPAKAPGKGDE